MDETELLQTKDAYTWAKEFCKRYPAALCQIEGQEGAVQGVDFQGIMLGWFANAIETAILLEQPKTEDDSPDPEQVQPSDYERDAAVLTVLDSAEAELAFAKKKFPLWPIDPLHATTIIAEEVGELHKATLQHVYEANKGVTLEDVREEAIQSIAMLVRFVAALDKKHYEWNSRRQFKD